MKSIKTSADLKLAIQQLEQQQAHELILLKAEYDNASENLKPINIIKHSLAELVAAPGLKTDVINAAVGLATGMLAKKLMIGKTINPFKKFLGIIVEMTVAGTVANHTGAIKAAGSAIFKTLFSKKEATVTDDGQLL